MPCVILAYQFLAWKVPGTPETLKVVSIISCMPEIDIKPYCTLYFGCRIWRNQAGYDWKLPPCWLVSIMPEGVLQAAAGKVSYFCYNTDFACYSTHLLGKVWAHWWNSTITTMDITNWFPIRFKVCTIWWNSYLLLKLGQKLVAREAKMNVTTMICVYVHRSRLLSTLIGQGGKLTFWQAVELERFLIHHLLKTSDYW